MFARSGLRQHFKQVLSATRVKLLYERITLTRFTSLYCFCAIISCFVLCALQVVSLIHDAEGISDLSTVIKNSQPVNGIAITEGDAIELCSGLPGQAGTLCVDVINFKDASKFQELAPRDEFSDDSDSESDDEFDDSDSESDDEFDDSDSDSDSDDEFDDDENGGEVITTVPPTATTLSSSSSSSISLSTSSPSLSFSSSSSIPLPTSSPPLSFSSSSSISPPTSSLPLSVSSTTSFLTSSTTTFVLSSTTSSSTRPGTTVVALPATTTTSTQARTQTPKPVVSTNSATPPVATDAPPVATEVPPVANGTPPLQTTFPVFSEGQGEIGAACTISLMWMNDVLHDIQREDVVLFIFQIWLLVLSFVAVLNESIPHLGAGLFGHVLGAAWSAYRVQSARDLLNRYRDDILHGACNSQNFLGNWWEKRINDTIPLLVLHITTLITVSWLSFKLYNVYASQTFKRAGASLKVNNMYKLVLVFSVIIQVSGFFSIASSAVWISKVTHAPLVGMVRHGKLYIGFFGVALLLEIPWLVLGWISVRRESRLAFAVFCAISIFMFAISISMFFSDMYRYIFGSWPFFATMTVTAFILLAGSVVLGLICRLNFGRGLVQHLQGSEASDEGDFAPVFFSWKGNGDLEKSGYSPESKGLPPHNVEYPVPVYAPDSSMDRGAPLNQNFRKSPDNPSVDAPLVIPVTRMSVFSKELKNFAFHAPAPSVRSLREDPVVGGYSNVVPVKTSPLAQTSAGSFADAIQPTQGPTQMKRTGPNSPTGKASMFSTSDYDRHSFASDRSSIRSLRSVGLPANPRSKAISDFRPIPF